MVFDGDRMVGVNAVFDKSNIFVISLNNTLGRKRLLASGQRLATKGIKDFHVPNFVAPKLGEVLGLDLAIRHRGPCLAGVMVTVF